MKLIFKYQIMTKLELVKSILFSLTTIYQPNYEIVAVRLSITEAEAKSLIKKL